MKLTTFCCTIRRCQSQRFTATVHSGYYLKEYLKTNLYGNKVGNWCQNINEDEKKVIVILWKDDTRMILPMVLQYLTPRWTITHHVVNKPLSSFYKSFILIRSSQKLFKIMYIYSTFYCDLINMLSEFSQLFIFSFVSFFGLGAVSAAVMSSAGGLITLYHHLITYGHCPTTISYADIFSTAFFPNFVHLLLYFEV